jgi:hypothetical protein
MANALLATDAMNERTEFMLTMDLARPETAHGVHERGGLWTPTGYGQPRERGFRPRTNGRWLPTALGQPRIGSHAAKARLPTAPTGPTAKEIFGRGG